MYASRAAVLGGRSAGRQVTHEPKCVRRQKPAWGRPNWKLAFPPASSAARSEGSASIVVTGPAPRYMNSKRAGPGVL